jgi:hypothetical protein
MKKDEHLKLSRFGDDRIGFKLEGDPDKPESTYASIVFPGGEVTVARVTGGDYWIHVNCFRPDSPGDDVGKRHGRFIDSRVDVQGKSAHEIIGGDFTRPDAYHVAVRVGVEDA